VTWNLHGAVRPGLDEIAERLRALDPDVVALQEVQCRQARALKRALGWQTARWSFKHMPLWKPAEGLAVLSPHRMNRKRTITLSRREPPWIYRRRIAQLCELDLDGHRLRLANTHLSSDTGRDRRAQAERLVRRLERDMLVLGDLNARPGRDELQPLLETGLRDAWVEAHGPTLDEDRATNWRLGDADERPSNALDYVLVPDGYTVTSVTVPTAAGSDLAAYRRLSDHLPVRVALSCPSPAGPST